MTIRPQEHDLITRLLSCVLDAKERGFLQWLVGRVTMSTGQFHGLYRIADRHKRQLRAMKTATAR